MEDDRGLTERILDKNIPKKTGDGRHSDGSYPEQGVSHTQDESTKHSQQIKKQ